MPRDNRCMYMAHVCFYVCFSDCVGICGNVYCVAAIVKNSCVFCLYCEAWSSRYSCMGSVSVSSCMSCVHLVAVLNSAFCMTCSLLMLVEDEIGDHAEEAYSRSGLITAL